MYMLLTNLRKNIIKCAVTALAAVLLFGSGMDTKAAEVIIYEMNGVLYYFIDGVAVTEDEYWQMQVEKGRYYDVGILGMKNDGTVMWYGNHQIFYSEAEALEYYITSASASGYYKMENGCGVWFWEGEVLESKEKYCELCAKNSVYTRWETTLPDGTRFYVYKGTGYLDEQEYLQAVGFYCADSEEDAKKAIDAWFEKGNSETSLKIACEVSDTLLDYFSEKAAWVSADNTFMSYREYIMRVIIDSSMNGYHRTEIQAVLWEETYGTTEEIKQARAAAKQVADTLRGKSTYEQIKGAYDWLCNNVKYDYSLENHSAYTALVLKNTVCEGYATAFQLIMEELGIECVCVMSPNHAWNAVKYEGKWYWVDATWGDQVTYVDYSWFLAGTNMRQHAVSVAISTTSYTSGGNYGNTSGQGSTGTTAGETEGKNEETTGNTSNTENEDNADVENETEQEDTTESGTEGESNNLGQEEENRLGDKEQNDASDDSLGENDYDAEGTTEEGGQHKAELERDDSQDKDHIKGKELLTDIKTIGIAAMVLLACSVGVTIVAVMVGNKRENL